MRNWELRCEKAKQEAGEEGLRSDRVYDRDRRDCAEGPWAGLPQGRRCLAAQTHEAGEDPGAPTPDGLLGEVSNRRPGRHSADWKFHHDRH